MAPRKPIPLISSLELESSILPKPPYIDEPLRKKTFLHYVPLVVVVLLLIAPHPSLLIVFVDYTLLTRHQPLLFGLHLFTTYGLTFLAFSSLLVCVVRDPGPVTLGERAKQQAHSDDTEPLIAPSDEPNAATGWCRRCAAPKPERTHHCSQCDRCILKMDHHCVWLANKCIGHRTYPAFVHFLGCVTLLAMYAAAVTGFGLWHAFNNPLSITETTPVHMIFLAFAGIVISFIIGSFFVYHLYLLSTNQTTLESLTPFLLLAHLPPLPPTRRRLSVPPEEHELGPAQRVLMHHAHAHIRLYDVGFRANVAQVLGWRRPWGWVPRILCGGASNGDGRTFPRNVRAEGMLARLASELVRVDET